MQCSICRGYDYRGRFCRTCGNDKDNAAHTGAPGIASLIAAYEALSYPRFDGNAAIPHFVQCLQYESSFPPVVRLVALFEYAMSFTRRPDYATLSKSLSDEELMEFIAVLHKAKGVYLGLPADIKQASVVREYESLIPGNLNEAVRIVRTRGLDVSRSLALHLRR